MLQINLTKAALIFVFLLNIQDTSDAQPSSKSKPALDTSVLGKWPTLFPPKISPGGNYIGYRIHMPPPGKDTFIIKDINNSWEQKYPGVVTCLFSEDDRQIVFQQGDSLHFLQPGRGVPERSVLVRSYQYPYAGPGEWVAYQEKGDSGLLILSDLLIGTERKIGKVSDYSFDQNGKTLLYTQTSGNDSTAKMDLYLLDLAAGTQQKIWRGMPGSKVQNYIFSDDGRQLAFLVTENGEKKENSIWCYHEGTQQALLKLKDGDPRIDSGLKIDRGLGFSKDGKWFLFTLFQSTPVSLQDSNHSTNGIQVDIWSYKDRNIQPEQLSPSINRPKSFQAALSTERSIYWQLDHGDTTLYTRPAGITGDMVLVTFPSPAASADPIHNFTYPVSFSLLSLKDGTRKSIRKKSLYLQNPSFSPDGKWLVYYDKEKGHYFSYEMATSVLRNLTKGMPARMNSYFPESIDYTSAAAPIEGWIKNTGDILLYDNYDLWKIDPSSRRPPVSITSGFGRSRHLKIRVIRQNEQPDKQPIYSYGDTLLLTGFNVENKYNGFLRQVLGVSKRPEVLYMGPYTFYRMESQKPHRYMFDNGMLPIKASKAECWVVKRESASESPNFFQTTDFRQYRPLTQLTPQANYNWLTTELVNYQQLDGTPCQGILYKPEDFDPAKKYPLIFNYYEQLSHRLFEFPRPEYMTDNINIPWMVSQGYLVFTPDIYYKPANLSGKTAGQNAYNSVIAAAKYLTKLSYVDGRHLGLQGHSFGGLETNDLIGHSRLFTAAAEVSGPADILSNYLTLVPTFDNKEENANRQFIKESGQDRLGAKLWDRPDLYLRASLILNADRIRTPLLMVHNKQDQAVPWRQGIELYMALRRLGKRSWMLQYDKSDHVVNPQDAIDYTTRLTQFFDYYLKESMPPKWMTEGISAHRKGLDQHYESDSSGRTP